MDQVNNNPQDNVTVPRELLLKIEESLELRCGTNAPERREILPQLRELLEQPAVEPVAEVVYLERGGNAGIATRIVEIDSPHRDRLQAGTKLFKAPQAQQPAPVPSWVSYDHSKDELTIYGKRYAASVFSNLLRVGSLLKVVEGQDDVVTLEKVAAQQPRKAVKLTPEEMKEAVCPLWPSAAMLDSVLSMYGDEYRAIEAAFIAKNNLGHLIDEGGN